MELLTKKITNDELDSLVIENSNKFNSMNLSIPSKYFYELIDIKLDEIIFAYENNFISNESLCKYIENYYKFKSDKNDGLIDLLIILSDDTANMLEVETKLKLLAKNNCSFNSEEIIKEKILFLVMKWLFDNLDIYEDPLRVVEEIYADFSYPESIKKMVRYEPADKNLIYDNRNDYLKVLYNNWEIYLDEQLKKYSTRLENK